MRRLCRPLGLLRHPASTCSPFELSFRWSGFAVAANLVLLAPGTRCTCESSSTSLSSSRRINSTYSRAKPRKSREKAAVNRHPSKRAAAGPHRPKGKSGCGTRLLARLTKRPRYVCAWPATLGSVTLGACGGVRGLRCQARRMRVRAPRAVSWMAAGVPAPLPRSRQQRSGLARWAPRRLRKVLEASRCQVSAGVRALLEVLLSWVRN